MAYMHEETFVISHRINQGSTPDSLLANPDDYFEVDDMIALTIQMLNRKGYLTGSCCSGHVFPELAGINDYYEDSYQDHCFISFKDGISLPTLPPEFDTDWGFGFSTDDKFAHPDTQLCIGKTYGTKDTRETMKCIFETMEQLYEWALTLPEYNPEDENPISIEKPANERASIDDIMKVAEEYIKSNELDMKLTSAEYVSDSDDIKLILYFTTEHEPDVPKEWGDGWDWPQMDSWWELACELVNTFKIAVKLVRVPRI